jgi:hypothetical protein
MSAIMEGKTSLTIEVCQTTLELCHLGCARWVEEEDFLSFWASSLVQNKMHPWNEFWHNNLGHQRKKINDGYIGSLLDSCQVHQSNFDNLNFHYTFKDDDKLIYIQHELNSICWTFYMHSRTSNFRHCLLILKWNSNY